MIIYHGHVMRALAAFAMPDAQIIDLSWEAEFLTRTQARSVRSVAGVPANSQSKVEDAPIGASSAAQRLLMDLPGASQPALMTLPGSARRAIRKRGHAGRPGSGPQGKTCGSCTHYRSIQGGARRFPKCALTRKTWTGGSGSDIRRCDPACDHWSVKLKEA